MLRVINQRLDPRITEIDVEQKDSWQSITVMSGDKVSLEEHWATVQRTVSVPEMIAALEYISGCGNISCSHCHSAIAMQEKARITLANVYARQS